MSEQENKALVRRLYKEVFANWNLAVLEELIAPAFISHGAPPGTPQGPAGVRQFYAWLRSAFPDIRYTIDDIVAADDKVVVRWTWRGTHKGNYCGIPPTGKQAAVTGIAIYRIEGGRCVERWVGANLLPLVRHLEARPETIP